MFFQQKDFDKLITLLPKLISRKAFDSARLEKIQISSYSGYLLKRAQTGQIEEINKAWKNIPRKVKTINQVFATYAGLLIEKEEYSVAERLLRKKIEANWDSQLVALYGEVRPNVSRKILKTLEKWAREHPNDIGLGIARARQFMQAGMWGQARGVVSHLVNQEPTPKMYKLLKEYQKITKYPILLNTSFNLKDQTMVRDSQEAIDTFMNCDMDYLVIDNIFISKKII